jgi:hypothetical protein
MEPSSSVKQSDPAKPRPPLSKSVKIKWPGGTLVVPRAILRKRKRTIKSLRAQGFLVKAVKDK